MSKVLTDSKKIQELLTRGVEAIYPSREDLEKVLKSGKRLRLYNGIDPTGPVLHLGHTVQLRKLRQFQELGHEVILLVGSFTAMIGDPTGKDAARKPLTREEVMTNAETYKKQAAKILNFDGPNQAVLRFNHEWHDKITIRGFLDIGGHITVPRLLERDMFKRRLKSGGTITLTEMIYPVLQGYDSVVMDVDLEVGGSDQIFNMLVGRDFQREFNKKEKFVLAPPLLTDASGRKIGKTEGNVIAVTDEPEELFGKIMALGDDSIFPVFELCTDLPIDEIEKMRKEINRGANPRDAKARLGSTIVEMYHSKQAALAAEKKFNKLFREHEVPEEMKEIKFKKDKWNIIDLLVASEIASSKSDARRLIEQGGIKVDGHALEGIDVEITVTKHGVVIQRGKRQFVKVVL